MKMSSNRKKKIMFLVGVFVFSFCALLVISCTPPPPQASLDSDVNSGNAPLIVQFSDTSQGTIDSWEWDFGDGTSSTEQNPSHEYTKTGTYTVQLTVSGPGGTHTSTSAERITVGSGTLAKVETDPSQVNLRIQDSAQLSAEATDQFGNEVEGVTCSWVTLGPEVTVTEVGQVTAGKISGRFPGLLKLTASKNGQTVESLIDVIITPGPIKTIKMEPTKATLDIRGTQLFSFIAFDEFGNEISDALSSWSVSSDIGNIDGNGLFTAGTKAGSFSDAIEIEAVEGTLRISATADVSISPDTLVNVDIQPPDVVVNGGASQQFTAVGLDQYGNEIPQLAFIWEARGGNIDDDGLFTAAGEGGVFEITAKAQSKGGMAMGSAKVEIPPNYPDFSSVSNLNLLGDAEIWNYNVLRVTPCKVFESGGSTVGAVWFKDKQMVKDGFETTFEFQLTNMSKGGGGGFAFVIQNHANVAMGTGGGALGYHAVLNSIAIEFDTDRDTWTLDPNDNHISVHTADTDGWNEADETYSIGSASPIINMSDREVHEVKIVYVPGTMTIFLDDLENPVLEVSIDIANPLNLDNGRAWVGFTASSNWARSENHDILSWSFVPK